LPFAVDLAVHGKAADRIIFAGGGVVAVGNFGGLHSGGLFVAGLRVG